MGRISFHNLIIILFTGIITGVGMTGCNSDLVFHQNKTIPGNVWHKDSIVSFYVDVKDSVSTYDFYLNLRHTRDYRYSNIYFFIETIFPDGRYTRDTVEFILADRQGKWYGKGYGSVKDYRVMLKHGVRFPVKGIYGFLFEQAMREEELKNITDIGISLEKN